MESVTKAVLPPEAVEEQVRAFRERLRPFGLDGFVLDGSPKPLYTTPDGRVLVELRTMALPIWYPQKLDELSRAGFEVVTFNKKYNKQPPCQLYYVRTVRLIEGEVYGN